MSMTLVEFKRRHSVSSGIVSLCTLVAIGCYLAMLLELPAAGWRGFGIIVAIVFPLLLGVTTIIQARFVAPVLVYLRVRQTGTADAKQVRRAYCSLSYLALRTWLAGMSWWSVAGLVVATAMELYLDAFSRYGFLIVVLASTSGGFVASTFHYYVCKWLYRDLRQELAQQIGSGDERRRLSYRLSLRHKLVTPFTGMSLVVVIFAMLVFLGREDEHLEQHATGVQRAWLNELAADLQAAGAEADRPFDRDTAAARARRLTIASDLVVFDAAAGRVLAGPAGLLVPGELALLAGAPAGDGRDLDSPNVFSWQRIGARGPIVVAVTPWHELRAAGGQTLAFTLVLVGIAGLLSLGLAGCLAHDIAGAADDLVEASARVAAGDLRVGLFAESEDELGDLARAFEVAAGALQSTVARVAQTADLVETAATEIAAVSQTVAAGATQQSQGVREAVGSIEGMAGQVTGIASSAQELNLLVEESSSSILEMGAAGEELADTAGVLSTKVDEASTSIAQLVRSVKEVSFQTGALSEAASETSASMEEMASAMRQVDTLAEQTARLSQHVVEAAEGGRARVQQTIDGMDSIRRATASAESVIAGLAGRAREIGSILDVIDDVADETNLLALNAAIIAAQAGDHGRAFSVVADEIKELADRVLASTKEIGGLIRAVQEESGKAAGAIAEGSRSVAAGVELSQQAGDALEEITRVSGDSGRHIDEIVRSVQEQSKAASHVASMMDRVSAGVAAIERATGEQDRGNETVSRSMIAMREVAQQMHATTAEQARGGARIRDSIDGVRTAAELINGALQAQSAACSEVAGFLEEVSASSRANDESSSRLGDATQALSRQAELLRDDVRRFVLDVAPS